jgi:type VI secretion system secreted protein VgrG
MPNQFTQDDRFLELTTKLGKDKPLLQSFTVSERVSGIYTLELDTLYQGALDGQSLLGTPVAIKVKLDKGERYFHGIVNEVEVGEEIFDSEVRFRRLRVVAVPALWLLTLTKDFRVFEKMTVQDILKKILTEASIQHRIDLSSGYTERDHCVQFRETTFNFISRLMEEEGIFYFFEHSNNKHTMVISDRPQAFKPCPQQSEAYYAPDLGPRGIDPILSWEGTHALKSGAYRLYDFHFEDSKRIQVGDVSTLEPIMNNTSYRIADSPGRFTQQFNKIGSGGGSIPEGPKFSRLRMEAVETHNPIFSATSLCRAFSSGQRFALKGGPNAGEYSITSMEHSGMQSPPYISGLESETLYTNTFTCIPYGKNFRPELSTERPVIVGPQTATVIEGPDKYSRVKVKFHWGENLSSAWVRVAQRWSGPGWGTIFIPRVQHEVIIEFINGDPDQPLIVGSLYNKQNMPPYDLPANKTQSGIKTRSMDAQGGQGGVNDFNELRFEDKTSSEDIYFHAQKDFHRVVENDDDLKVGHDQTIEIKNHRTETVKDGNEKVTIEKGNREIFVDKGNDKHQVKMGNREAIIDMGNESLTVKMGNQTTKINLGKSETEAMQSIELKVGQSSVKLDQTGVTIKGIMIKIEGMAMIETKSPIGQHKADALMMIKGGITMIN